MPRSLAVSGLVSFVPLEVVSTRLGRRALGASQLPPNSQNKRSLLIRLIEMQAKITSLLFLKNFPIGSLVGHTHHPIMSLYIPGSLVGPIPKKLPSIAWLGVSKAWELPKIDPYISQALNSNLNNIRHTPGAYPKP